jgi:hypothetical protein
LRELIGQLSAQIDLQNSEQKVLEYRISKLNEQYESQSGSITYLEQ